MAGLLLALLILVLLGVRWQWEVRAGRLLVNLNEACWDRPFVCQHGPKALPWWQLFKVMPWRIEHCTCPAWNVFVYTRRTTRCHYVAWRPRGCGSWFLARKPLR